MLHTTTCSSCWDFFLHLSLNSAPPLVLRVVPRMLILHYPEQLVLPKQPNEDIVAGDMREAALCVKQHERNNRPEVVSHTESYNGEDIDAEATTRSVQARIPSLKQIRPATSSSPQTPPYFLFNRRDVRDGGIQHF